MTSKCKNNPDRFCYICSNVVLPNGRAKITDFVKKTHGDYLGVRLGDLDKPFASHVWCKTFVENLKDRKIGKQKSMPFAISVVWREGKIPLWTNIFA